VEAEIVVEAVVEHQVSIDAYTVDNYFEAKFDTGILAHTALLGVDHQRRSAPR
jgi:outer membrane receptor protein involved in Fe transport